MAVFFTIGAALGLVGLLLAGELTWSQVWHALVLAPALLVGALLAVPLRNRLRGPTFRHGVLAVCSASAVVLVVAVPAVARRGAADGRGPRSRPGSGFMA